MIYNILEGYDVVLKRLTEDKIELVRHWRNDPKISKYMEFRDHITPDMQRAWFEKINNNDNYYFIIVYKGNEIGLINIKDIDWQIGQGESGSFIYDDKYLNTDIAYRAHIVLYDYFFNILKGKSLRAHILADNNRSIRFSCFLGYKEVEKNQYILIDKDYFNNLNRSRFIKRWNKLYSK